MRYMYHQSIGTAPNRVLITGADGKIGRAVVKALMEKSVPVTALSSSWSRPSVADRVVAGDATDPKAVAHAFAGASAVVHLAAITHPKGQAPMLHLGRRLSQARSVSAPLPSLA